ncbi:hypothetical protein AFCA_009579 [Aspergillus flavus]|nr:hypothetical protein AFCA_009579 [Aspergillus flavus]
MNPRPHSVDLTINSTLHLPVDIPVRIDPLTLNLGSVPGSSNSPFAQVYIPGTTVGGTAVLGVQNQTTQLNNQQWLEYVRSMIFEETVVMSVVARVDTFLGILKSNVVFNKEIEQKDSVVKLVTYDGVEVPYYTDAMHNLTMTAKLPLVELGLDTLGGIMEDRGIGLPFLSKLRSADG